MRRRSAENALERAAGSLDRLEKLERNALEHDALLKQLQLDRPAFVTALEELAERCHDILDQAEAKRARVEAADRRRAKKDGATPGGDGEVLVANDREATKANVRSLLRAQGKL